MKLTMYTLDAFTDRVFSGNPAAVCPLTEWLDDATMQNIAAENNLSETAFFVPDGDGYHIRWFTPACEVELCGHATLASSYVIKKFLAPEKTELNFRALAGTLRVTQDGGMLSLDFPSRPPEPAGAPAGLVEALGATPSEILKARDYVAVFEDADTVSNLQPDMAALGKVDMYALIATARGKDCDFVSRFFAPGRGIDEDPVTGSAHCTLIPLWAARLGKNKLHARQVSRRGGELFCELLGDRVKISGHVVLYAEGSIYI
jgi:PhzF family phenazine biosynthesis protein